MSNEAKRLLATMTDAQKLAICEHQIALADGDKAGYSIGDILGYVEATTRREVLRALDVPEWAL